VYGLDEFDEDDSTGTVFRDVILLALIGFVAIVIMLLPHIKPTQEDDEDHRAPGNLIVEMHWPTEMPYDVDLWVKAPDAHPVGFWNLGNEALNLLRDDLGHVGDATKENYEITYSRGIPEGEFIVNVHMYGPIPKNIVIPVNVVVSVKKPGQETRQILKTVVDLKRHNQEETAFRFKMSNDGDLVDGSVSTLAWRFLTAPPK